MITNVVIPGFGGPILAERVAVIRQKTKVLYTSRYADDGIVHVPDRLTRFLRNFPG
jgi:hypothetical protein